MSQKYYRPIIKEGDHLVKSKSNPNRVRGLSRDENNQNQDIIEWEEVEIDEPYDYSYNPDSYNQQKANNSQELSEEDLELIAAGIVAIVIGGKWLIGDIVVPWWKSTAWPWLCDRGRDIKSLFSKNKKEGISVANEDTGINTIQPEIVSEQIDKTFESCCIDMSYEEAECHIMNIINHMIGLANEIRIMSNARIKDESETEEIYLARQKESERFLAEKLAYNLNRLLADEHLRLDVTSSKEVFSLTGGGIRLNGEYVPVEVRKIEDAILAFDTDE